MSTSSQRTPELAAAVTSLLRSVVYRDTQEALWREITQAGAQIRDFVAVLGLQLVIDEGEGYAYLRQVPDAERDERIPRLVPRRELSFEVSLLLALLRRRLAQADAEGGGTRVVVTRDEVVDMLRVFVDHTDDGTKLVERTDALVRKVADLGFIRPVRSSDDDAEQLKVSDSYEIRRILKAFVDAQWLADFDARLTEYLSHAGGH